MQNLPGNRKPQDSAALAAMSGGGILIVTPDKNSVFLSVGAAKELLAKLPGIIAEAEASQLRQAGAGNFFVM